MRVPAAGLHGDKGQGERDYTLRMFRKGRIGVLVATDVAARGLDVDDIKYVINYDFPHSTEDYIHRIGRTGRASQTGTSHTFFTKNDGRFAENLIKILRESHQEVDPELEQMARNNARRGGGRGGMGRGNRWYGGGGGGYQSRGFKSGGGGGGGGSRFHKRF